MVLWRISRHLDLSGIGGLRAKGRWHGKGSPVVYMSENQAAALLEVCVHTATNKVASNFRLLRIEGPQIEVPTVVDEDLSQDWPTQMESTQALGTAWLNRGEQLLLRVPCAIVPYTWNFLFNPLHGVAREFAITEVIDYPFDMRIKR